MSNRNAWLTCLCCTLGMSGAMGADAPAPPLEKPGWTLTFHDEFERPQLDDMYWFRAYRSGRKEYFKRIGHPSRWVDHNAHYVIEDGVLKLRIDEHLPFRPDKSTPCVSCIQTSDHRFGATTDEFQILDKFAQKYGWFEIRAKCVKGSGLLNAFWLHQHDPTKQEYTPEGECRKPGYGAVEIDIFELPGKMVDAGRNTCNIHFKETAALEHASSAYHMDFDASTEFHVWAMEWQEGQIDWFLDGEVVKSYTGPTPQEKMFVLVALFQYSSSWLGDIDPDMTYPKDFEIDYVRVYARDAE
ncbi:MAG: glycoside hydrolase family 16 protein [Candidatus Hydrogenedentes bacterium]|nr:glycoside hydrolase family 16 protein [Candidatus Hydrogenedentota bacterium]